MKKLQIGKKPATELNERQKRFVDSYIQTGGNLSESARQAGYSDKSCGALGNNLLKNVKIQAAIQSRIKELESERIANTQEILEYFTSTMRGEREEEVVVNVGIGKGYTRAEKVMVKVGAKERLKAAELLAKVNGMFLNKQEIELSGALPVVIADDL